MTACHDPYKELELYLEKAQEEIGKAVEELREHEEAESADSSLLLPPKGFRSPTWNEESDSKYSKISSDAPPIVNRICHDGNLLDFDGATKNSSSLGNSHSSKLSYFSTLRHEILPKNGSSYSPNTRRRLWQMHPSVSFPETAKELLLLKEDAISTPDSERSNKRLSNGYVDYNSNANERRSRTLDSRDWKTCRRSNSGYSPRLLHETEDLFQFPRPPSGDVNLLSIWANNLVLELDKSLSGELNSAESFSPSSDYSLSPTKQDGTLEASTFNSALEVGVNKSQPLSFSHLSLPGKSLKQVSMSPDSGIEQISCVTPDMMEDCVDTSAPSSRKLIRLSSDLLIPSQETDIFTPPPPEFGDENTTTLSQDFSPDKKGSTKKLKAAESVYEDSPEILESTIPVIFLEARSIASQTVELEDSPIVRNICTLHDVPLGHDSCVRKISERSMESETPVVKDYRIFFSLPKPQKVVSYENDKWCSLPRDCRKNLDVVSPQRSASSSAVSSTSHVSIDELAAFIRRINSSSNQPPLCADVSTDVKEDKGNKDAVTQTTPVPFSRSSSFTWVTECDCNEWGLPTLTSGSEDSLLMSKCTSCKVESANRNSSSSSLGISSEDDDDDCEAVTPGSGTSSLYLSACSGSSDSFDDASLATITDGILPEQVKPVNESLINANRRLRNSEITLKGSSTLGDISEEQGTNDTVSIKSTVSNPSFMVSNAVEPTEQSASFPSTLKVTRKSKSTGSPAQPIEPTVLIVSELNLKSVSAPVLLRQKRHVTNAKVPETSSSESSPPMGVKSKECLSASSKVPARAHSAKELNELQAIEACSWLRAAGFPQYAQMYEDNQFPIDISVVQKDHAFLHPDSIQSLFRRLNTLNRCAKMKFVDHIPRKSLHMDESDDEEQYALSENWEFQRSSRRWSRIPSPSEGLVPSDAPIPTKSPSHLLTAPNRKYLSSEDAYCSSHDSVFVDEQHSSPDSVRRCTAVKTEKSSSSPLGLTGDCSPGSSSGSGGTLSFVSEETQDRRNLRRSGSDRVKDGAKALFKRMESLKGKRKKKGLDTNKLDIVNIFHSGSSSSSLTSSPQFQRPVSSLQSTQTQSSRKKGSRENFPNASEDMSTHSDPECHMFIISEGWKDANSNDTKHIKHYIAAETSVTLSPTRNKLPYNPKPDEGGIMLQKKNMLHPDKSSNQDWEDSDKRCSYYDNICAPIVVFNDLYAESLDRTPMHRNSGKRSGLHSSYSDKNLIQQQDDGDIIIINTERRDSGVGSSLTRGITYQQAPWHCFPVHYPSEVRKLPCPTTVTELTAPQMLLLRKLSLLKITTIMEKFSPSSRTGWSWAVPKFIRRIRSPDYKDKVVFGVPLLLILQRTGQPLPISIQTAINHLRNTALDSTGLFRKSGVRSRIQKLKQLTESNPEKVSYEDQQSYDVADMVKQYFRELPEVLLTNKLSEIFISIFQYVPEDLRLEAIRAALILMPDENREVLRSLLEFLHEVCQNSGVNQMTATNLAVCFAPSLFHLSTPRSTSSSPHRRKTVGVPDLKELNENRSAYECLSCMVTNCKTLFSVSDEMISQSRISSATHFHLATLEELSSFIWNGQSGWKAYIESCIQMFLKEAREKYKGWINVSQNDHVDLSYKKLADGHPLRLWKVSTEVEAPPVELLNRILRERHLWDNYFTKWKVIKRLNKQTEIIQFLSPSLPLHTPSDYCVLRSWRTDLPKGTCVLIETSIDHLEAEATPSSVRALVLTSRYLIEPCGSGKSRITHLSRVDTRGRSPEWYNRAYGHICTLSLAKLRNSFSRTCADGPETKV